MNKICTSIEQSKKLIELGIDRKSSDMYYWCGEDLRIGGYKAQCEEFDIPCWSLAALLDIIDSVKMYVMNRVTMIVGKYAANQWFVELERVHDNSSAMLTASEQLIDACVEMIVKLKEKKLI